MILLYSGAEKPNYPQKSPDLSLGGYVSNSSIPNAYLNNLFGSLERQDILTLQYDVRLIVLKNITSAEVDNAKLYTITPSTAVTAITFALVQPSIDPSCNAPYYEQIMNGQALPYYADFQSYEGLDNAFTLPSIAVGATVGIWMMRQVTQAAQTAAQTQSTCQAVIAQFNNPTAAPSGTDTVQFIINY